MRSWVVLPLALVLSSVSSGCEQSLASPGMSGSDAAIDPPPQDTTSVAGNSAGTPRDPGDSDAPRSNAICRMVDASEIASVTAFLASDRAWAICGELVVATGGAGRSVYY